MPLPESPRGAEMRRIVIATILAASSVQPALAAGFAVREQSAEAMGSAYAGAAATGSDASYLSYNPAAAAATDYGDVSLNAIAILPNAAASDAAAATSAGTPVSGNKHPTGFIRNAVVPNLALRQRLSGSWSVGLSVSVPWGLSTYYSPDNAGRYYAFGTKLTTYNVTPVVAYDLAPGIVIAGGFQAEYAKATLSSVIDTGLLGTLAGIPGSQPGAMDSYAFVNAHSWAYGFVLGARAALEDGWTFGLSYRSAMHHTLKGPLTFVLDPTGLGAALRAGTGMLADTTARAKIPTPQTIDLGVRKQIDERWTALLEVDWTGWSDFQALRVVAANPAQPDDVTSIGWHDSWLASVGAEYAASDRWTLRGGVAFDGSPVPDSTLGPRVPDADRYWVSAGVTYRASRSADLKLTFSHLFNDTRNVAQSPLQPGNALRGALAGSTESNADMVGLQIVYRWQ